MSLKVRFGHGAAGLHSMSTTAHEAVSVGLLLETTGDKRVFLDADPVKFTKVKLANCRSEGASPLPERMSTDPSKDGDAIHG